MYCPEYIELLEKGKETPIGILKTKMEEVLPNSIKEYKNKTIEIITGDLKNKQSIIEIVEIHRNQIKEFISKHRDVVHEI